MANPKMQIYPLLITALLTAYTSSAQKSICIAKGATENSLDFKPDQVNSYLHPERYKIFLFGELHNGGFNAELEYHLVTYLNQHAGIRHVFKEMSVSNAWHYNQYLRTGDTAYLANRNMVANYGQWPLFWRRLYAYNSTLPDSLKIIVHGLDFEYEDVFQTILELAPAADEIPLSLKPVMDTVKAHLADEPVRIFTIIDGKMIEYDNSRFTASFTYVQNQFITHSEDAVRYFGKNYPVIRDIALNKSKVTAVPKPRNKTMFQAMRRIVQEQKIEKFMGIFGAMHTTYAVPSSLANAARRLPNVRGKDVLNVTEIVYNLRRRDSTLIPFKGLEKAVELNTGCKATIVDANVLPGYRRKADLVIIGDAMK